MYRYIQILWSRLATLCLLAMIAESGWAANPAGDLRIEVITAYNLVVDSNVESPSSYAPRAAYLGAIFYNDGAGDMTNVFAYIGNYVDGTNDTPGVYPTNFHSAYPIIFGPLSGAFALTHEGGASGTADATRYLGTIPAGGSVAVYWLISYPNKDIFGKAVWGPSIKPDDDLRLQYDVWCRSMSGSTSLTATVTRDVYMRNEISSAANKIFPNSANKVPQQYLDLIRQYTPLWTNTPSDGTVGTRVITQGFWYDLGNVGDGFDNNGDLVPDRNAWLQPVGDPALFDTSAFRLIRTHALVVVKLKSGGEYVYNVDNQLYFENIPENNGAVGLVQYDFIVLKPNCFATFSPYQEVASGYDNEKFSGDYGATIGDPLNSYTSRVDIAKSADKTLAQPGEKITYLVTFTNSGALPLGDPNLGTPLVIQDAIPSGTYYVAYSATNANILPAGVMGYTVLFSTNRGSSWLMAEPAAATNVTHIQWWLQSILPAGGGGRIGFAVTAAAPSAQAAPLAINTAGISLGNNTPFGYATVETRISGTNRLGDTVFSDNGAGGGTFGNGIKDGSEPGISNVTVWLYYDLNTNLTLDAGDVYLGSNVTDMTGTYGFQALADGRYLAVVNLRDPDIPYGYTITTSSVFAVDLDYARTNSSPVVNTNADFGFAPALVLTKTGTNTLREGYFTTYTIGVSNRLAGNGGLTTYTIWATNGVNAANPKGWWYYTNAFIPPTPDGRYAEAPLNTGAENMTLQGFTWTQGIGNITSVIVRLPYAVLGTLDVGDSLLIECRSNTTAFFTTNYPNLSIIPTSGELLLNVSTNRKWSWSDFGANGLLKVYFQSTKGGGSTGTWGLDAGAYVVTSDTTVSPTSNPASTLDPIPLFDTYDADILRYVSATPVPTSVTTNGTAPSTIGILAWNSIDPLFPSGKASVTVTFEVLEPTGNTTTIITNTAYVNTATYASGTPANAATGTAVSTVNPAGAIGDFIWRDIDGDGQQDAGEPGIKGVTVILKPPVGVDAGNGPGIPVTNITTSSGMYWFRGLPADGTYTVTVQTATLPGGFGTNTWDRDGNSNSQTAVYIDYDTTTGTDTVSNADFGYRVSSSIEGAIWHDFNRGGESAPGPGENWLTNVVVYLFRGTTTGSVTSAIATNRTDTNGYFRFTGNYTGNFCVLVSTNTGMMTNAPWSASYDTDGLATPRYATSSVPYGGSTRLDFSFYKTGSLSVGDTVYYDWNGNRVRDANEESMFNIRIYLYEDENGDGVIDRNADALVYTATNGYYSFTNLPPTNYIVMVDETSSNFPSRFFCTADPYGANDGLSAVRLATSNRLDQDFGYQPYGAGALAGFVWRDMDGNGIRLGGTETGIVSISVTLQGDFNGDGAFNDILSTQTATNGTYRFSNLPDGLYRITVSTNDTDLPADIFSNRYVSSTAVFLTAGVTNGSDGSGYNFGFTPLGAIGDRVFWDGNQNGTLNSYEIGVAAVTVRLYTDANANGVYDYLVDTFVASTVTSNNGAYQFTGLSTGRYVVVVNTASGPLFGRTCSADPDADGVPFGPGCDGQVGVRIYPGTIYMGADFGFVPAGIIGDTLWQDVDGNGIRDSTESGIPYITIELYTNTVLIATNVTDNDGYYIFSTLSDGIYDVLVRTNDTDFPPGLVQAYDPDSVTNNRGSAIVVSNGAVVSIGGVSTTNGSLAIDFGYRFAGTNVLSGTIGLDGIPYDGRMGAGNSGVATNEAPFPGVNLYLYLWNDDGDMVVEAGETEQILSTTTSTNGDYTFSKIPQGDGNDLYLVSLAAPAANLVLTTTNGSTPATKLAVTTNNNGAMASAYQAVPAAAVITNMDFAFRSLVLYDFGDLPQSYGTLFEGTPSGARNIVNSPATLYLGTNVDNEVNGIPTTDADGDGADENGVAPQGIWFNGTNGGVVQVAVGAGSGWLAGFIDLNNDGDMTDSGELVVTQSVSSTGGNGNGVYTNTFSIPANAIKATNATALYARFRLFDTAVTFPELASSGPGSKGEVEDYRWIFGALSGVVWRDVDGDGSRTGMEPVCTNVRVFVDRNGDSHYQSNEVAVLTDSSGWYGIGGLCTGLYAIVVDTNTLPAYVAPSYDLDGTVTAHRVSVSITNGQVSTNVDFGYRGMAIGGQVWLDTSTNGLQDEVPLTGVTNIVIRLLDSGTNLLSSMLSGANGSYIFDIALPGTYLVECFPGSYLISPPNFGGDDSLDSDVSTNAPYRTGLITVNAGDRLLNWDLGLFRPAASNAIGDRVWLDANNDGIQDTDENGLAGVTVALYDANTNFLQQTITDSEGLYRFAGFPGGSYLVKFQPEDADYSFSPVNATTDDEDSDAATNGFTPLTVVTLNAVNFSLDAGLCKVLDLEVNKTVNLAAPDVGDIIWYTVTISNHGPIRATGVVVTDNVPTNLTVLGAGPSMGVYVATSGLWTINTISNGQAATLVITGQVNSGTSGEIITNTAAMTAVNEFDTIATNNSGSAVISVGGLDLAVFKSVDNPTPFETSNVVFTIIVTNYGPRDATGVRVTDILTNGFTHVTNSPSKGSYTASNGLWIVDDLAVGNGARLTLTAKVNTNTGGTTLTNNTSISELDQEDSVATNNTASATVVVRGADLALTKICDHTGVGESAVIVYSLVITNLGPNAVTNVQVREPLTNGVTYSTSTVSRGNYNTNSGTWTVGDLSVGAGGTLAITAVVNTNTAGWAITNKARITWSSLPDPNTNNNFASWTVYVSDLSLYIYSDVYETVDPGSNITYTLIVTNAGIVSNYNVAVTDEIPVGVSYVANSAAITKPVTTNNNVCDEFGTIAYTNSNGTLPWANAWQEIGETDGAGNGYVDVATDWNAYTLRITRDSRGVWRQASLASYTTATLSFNFRRIALDDSGDTVSIYASSNGGASWTSLGTITGPDQDLVYQATNYDISAFCSTNTAIRFLSAGLGQGDYINFDDINVALSKRIYADDPATAPPNLATGLTLLASEYARITMQVTVHEPPTVLVVTNTATATSPLLGFPLVANTNNNVTYADVAVEKIINEANPGTNEIVWYTITVTNNGPRPATQLFLQEHWPTNHVAFSNASPTKGTYDNALHRWNVGTLSVGAGATMVLTGRVSVAGNVEITNAVSVFLMRQYDPNLLNNTSRVAVVTIAVIGDVQAWQDGTGHTVAWTTISEHGTLGYYVYRLDGTQWRRINTTLMAALPGTIQGARYRLADPTAPPTAALTYRIDEVELNGSIRSHGPYEVPVLAADPVAGGTLTDVVIPRVIAMRSAPETDEQEEAMAPPTMPPATGGQPRAIKIGVRARRLYVLDAATLAAAGGTSQAVVSNSIASRMLRLRNKNVPVAYQPWKGGIRFFGQPPAENPYTSTNVYWLEWTTGIVAKTVNGAVATPGPWQTFTGETVFESNLYAATALFSDPGKDYWLWEYMLAGHPTVGSRTFTAHMEGLTGIGLAVLNISLQGASKAGIVGEHHVRVKVNGTTVGEARGTGFAPFSATFTFNAGILVTGNNLIELTSLLDAGVPYSTVYLDGFRIAYNRYYTAVNNRLIFPDGGHQIITVNGFTKPDIVVFDITKPRAMLRVTGALLDKLGADYRVSFKTQAGHRYLASADMQAPDWVAADTPSTLRSATNAAKHLIITVSKLAKPAQWLADYRTAKGLRSRVVLLEDIYDQFNSGMASPFAIRSFLRRASQNWAVKPRYVLLLGAGTYDYKGYTKSGVNLVPPMLVATPQGLMASDNWYGDFDNDGVPELAIGRLPAVNRADVREQIGKIQGYEAFKSAAWMRVVLLTADNPDHGGDFRATSEQLAGTLARVGTMHRAYLGTTALGPLRSMILTEWNSGIGFVNYFGHAGLDRLGAEGIFTSTDAMALTNRTKLPIVTAMTCVMGQFSVPGLVCLGEQMILNPDGGAIAVWAPSGLSLNDEVGDLSYAFYRAAFAHGALRLGDVVKSALTAYAAARRTKTMAKVYNLLGDPALGLAGRGPWDGAWADGHADWRGIWFSRDEVAAGLAADDADPDNDGVRNLEEYAAGSNPRVGGSGVGLATARRSPVEMSDGFVVQYTRNRDAGDLVYTLQVSDQPAGPWVSGPPYVQETRITDDGNGLTETVTARVTPIGASATRAFVRLIITKP